VCETRILPWVSSSDAGTAAKAGGGGGDENDDDDNDENARVVASFGTELVAFGWSGSEKGAFAVGVAPAASSAVEDFQFITGCCCLECGCGCGCACGSGSENHCAADAFAKFLEWRSVSLLSSFGNNNEYPGVVLVVVVVSVSSFTKGDKGVVTTTLVVPSSSRTNGVVVAVA